MNLRNLLPKAGIKKPLPWLVAGILIVVLVSYIAHRRGGDTHEYQVHSAFAGGWPVNTMGYRLHGGPGMWNISNLSGNRVVIAFGEVHTAVGYLADACRLKAGDKETWHWVKGKHHLEARTQVGLCHIDLVRVSTPANG
ncbi:hypothetical protein NR402_07420 [Acidithiobacillus ferrooxidans]|jgi:hypothetical protein|uniref:hypothetical protein n=1 Tax=Acidithiobacillus ferrooxidans TaxID=920 RepID=UPI000AFCD29F|nr:hypothetical protein [Acidithiobacillus ferrooxidans]MCR2830110.1 hypothetical protein [Acidithiobacillus ferrooxidans]